MIGAYNRDISRRKALRKRRLAKEIYHSWHTSDWEYYDNLHQYSKNKIHYSYPCGSTKTKNKGKKRKHHGNYCRSHNYNRSDLIKLLIMDDQMRDEGYSVSRRHVKEWI